MKTKNRDPQRLPRCDEPSREPARRVRFVLHTTKKIELDGLRACLERCLVNECSREFPDLLSWSDKVWELEPERKGKFPEREKRPRVDEATLQKRKEALAAGRPADLPLRLEPVEPPIKELDPRFGEALLGNRFVLCTLPEFETEFRRRVCCANARLYDVSYRMRRACGLDGVTPDLQYPGYTALSGLFAETCPAAAVPNWQLANIGRPAVPAAINGAGVTIGHPDTGWTAHAELNFAPEGVGAAASPSFNLAADFNVLNLSTSAREPVPNPSGLGEFPFHGTRTAGMIVSAPGFVATRPDVVTGVAPAATIVSIRCIETVVLIGDVNVAIAVLAAISAGVQVISISLGGYPSRLLRWAIQLAVASNILVVAAAGNMWPFVVYPAAYPECVAVTANTALNTVWGFAARDWLLPPRINIAAPGQCITNAMWAATPAPPLPATPTTNVASGTSFATPLVAGAAALWLQFFGRAGLIAGLGGRAPLQALFQAHLRATAFTPAGWNTLFDGPGILSLPALLTPATLPPAGSFELPFWVRELATPPGISGVVGTGNTLPGMPGGGGIASWIEALFGGNAPDVVEQYADELGQIVLGNPVVAAGIAALGEAVGFAENAVETAQQAAELAAAGAAGVVEDTVEALEDAAEAAGEAAGDAVESVGNAIADAASSVLGGLFG